MTCAALRSVRVVSTCTWRGVFLFVSHRVTCRIGNTPPWSSMGTSTTVSARCQVYSRPVSPVKATSVNCSAGRSGMVPLRQVSGSNPAAAMCANRAGDHPPRSKPTRTRRSSPTAVRSSGSNRASSPASDAPGSDITTRTGPPSPPATQVSTVAGASLAGELARLLPELRTAVGDDRRGLVGFDRGGWSPALFAHMAAAGFDPLTWRKGFAENLEADLFTDVTYVDETGRGHAWRVADTTVDLPTGDDQIFTMRQVSLLVAGNKSGRAKDGQASTRQIHILTTRGDLPVEQVIYRMGSRWRQENYFRYARMHFDLDSHDAYATTQDDPARLVPNPARKKAHQQVLAARARYDRALAATDAALLQAVSPPPGQSVLITNADHDTLTADLRAARADLDAAQAAHRCVPARLPLGQVNPGQQVLDVQTKLISHAIRIAAFNTATTLARAIRVHTGYARANDEAHALVRQALTGSGDIDPGDGVLTVRLDPLPTGRATAAIAQLCEHLTATQTRYPGTDLILRYEVKTRP